ncbi:MAG: alanine--tRNA ligase [Minisyncoccia bacterium]
MTSEELRQQFLDFFKEKGHRIIPSSSLIPENDPSVLFTTAGMQQFKYYYTGKQNPLVDKHFSISEPLNNKNVATCQKCLRTSDIESVGDQSHLTFFEMLGNFSFGGYFKKEAITFAYELLNSKFHIPDSRITVTVFEGDKNIPRDEESAKTWYQFGFSEKNGNLLFLGKDSNFWGPTGNEGPCGPTTEIYVDGIEIWNLVFNEYYKHLDQTLTPLTIKGVDTGMGLERLALVTQYPQDKNKTIYDTDLFQDLLTYLKHQGTKQESDNLYRIIADHFKASVFLAGTGIVPSNTQQGYILRRLIRRIVRFSKILNFKNNWIAEAYEIIKEKYGYFYPEINNQEEILSIIDQETNKFESSLIKGLKEWQRIVSQLSEQEKTIPGATAFYLYESYGFPIEILEEMAKEINKTVDRSSFEAEFQKHQVISRASQEKKFGGHGINEVKDEDSKKQIIKLHTATHLLLAALRQIIDSKIEQKGSDITPERLRLDFPFSRKLTEEEIKKIENLINQKIQENLEVHFYETNYEQAIKEGALGSFKDRYPEKVTVYEIKSPQDNTIFSKEICAGPHVSSTKEMGVFKIIKEESVGQGIRRIKATLI